MHATTAKNTDDHQEQFNMVFANHGKADLIYPLTRKETSQAEKQCQPEESQQAREVFHSIDRG
jgi:hypothetical protein